MGNRPNASGNQSGKKGSKESYPKIEQILMKAETKDKL
jgi:hypothetical protein